jgi:hypothetical protein
MNFQNRVKTYYKNARWLRRRKRVSNKWGNDALQTAPIVFGNAMPKSGSHLLFQVLQGLAEIGPFVVTGFPPVNRNQQNQKLDQQTTFKNLQKMLPGDIGYGYIHAREPFITELTGALWATMFIFRDPRDVLVSHVFYATQLHQGHGMNKYYTLELKSMEERINAAITGVKIPGNELNPIRDKYLDYLGWLEIPEVLCLKFEDLIENRIPTLERILDFIADRGFVPEYTHEQSIQLLRTSIAPGRSGTYRKGKTGSWREHFTENNIDMFKEKTGDLLIRLGYENDLDW